MPGDVAVAAISASSALAASLITGLVTWLVMRTQLLHQAREQRSARREQLLRDVCAKCLEAISKARLELVALGRASVAQSGELRAAAERELDVAVRALFTHRTHLALIAEIKLQRLAADMADAFEALWYRQEQTLAAAVPVTEDDLWSAQTQEAEKLEETMAQFVAGASETLRSL
ncbi:hypothetical protein PV963_22395 [Streptomyces coeruleorubidus]|uniref:hypothetical protein n=1 Tax=Streptomyces coeruleorubidus TaxID=116188 RepID=UPI00237F2C8B|nr:hypothetical protein [Streptomyces coeruleorubidus]WDV52914.1 hypothetical protein PV963_22395 [Streptomyces coeruleorubidus]